MLPLKNLGSRRLLPRLFLASSGYRQSLPFLGLLATSLQLLLLSSCAHLPCVCIYFQISIFFIRTPVDLESTLFQHDLISLITSAKTFFQTRSWSQVSGVRTSLYHFGEHILTHNRVQARGLRYKNPKWHSKVKQRTKCAAGRVTGGGGVVCGYSREEGLLQMETEPARNLQREAGSKQAWLQSPEEWGKQRPRAPILTKEERR